MTIDAMMARLAELREQVGGDAEVGLFDQDSQHDFKIREVTRGDKEAWIEF